MAVCPGFVRTEFHERHGRPTPTAPHACCGSTPTVSCAEALADLDAGKALSIPSKRYKAIAAVARVVPASLQQRFQGLGRK